MIECKRCLMNDRIPDFFVTKDGCNYCDELIVRQMQNRTLPEDLNDLIENIKHSSRGKKYDCVVGLSGGLDSTYALHLAVKAGLKPLAVHMDNGWNSELAQNNISNIIDKLGVDLYTHVIEWGEYRDMMQAFFSADVIDVELLYDNAMLAVNYRLADKYGIKYILGGTNNSTEGIRIPPGWNWYKYDKTNIVDICKRFSNSRRFKTFPFISTVTLLLYTKFKRIKWLSFLDYFEYDKNNAMDEMVALYGYKPYPYKHYESIFTRFYQGYILPSKFKVDKRLPHLSALVATKQMDKSHAHEMLDKSPYPNPSDLNDDLSYFLKKMKWTDNDLTDYISRPPIPHDAYKSERAIAEKFRNFKKRLIS